MPGQLTTNADALRLFFTDDIYLTKEPLATKHQKVEYNFQFLGNNGRKILLLVNDEQNEVSDEKGRELLRKIVKSINLSAADFALVNYARHRDVSFNDLVSFFSSNLVFSFGVSPAQLGLATYPLNAVVMEGSVRLIFSDELRKLDQDINGKKSLWAVLQKLAV